MWVELFMVLVFVLRDVLCFLWFSSLQKTNTSKFLFDLETVTVKQ